MFYRQRAVGSYGAPIQPATKRYTFPPSVGGINTIDAYVALPPTDCIYAQNLMPAEQGMQLRKGYREHNTGVGTTDDDVRAIIPFEGTDPANNKLFCATADGIYDISTDGDTSPTRVQTFSITTSPAGYCNWTQFTTDAAETYLYVACPVNGLFQYVESTDTWGRPSFSGTGYADTDVAHVALHKQRLWLTMQDSTDAYYSGVASIAGSVTKFTFGSKFQYGGRLLGLYNWTLDGGDGVDDYFVAISKGGDVLAYRGPDPSDASWTITGSYFVGEMPESRRCCIPYGGELYILSTYGITSLRDLVGGVDASENPRSPSAKINPLLRRLILLDGSEPQWQLVVYPGDGFMQVITPWDETNSATQYTQNLLTKGWGTWQTVPINCADTWEGNYYMGGEGGIVYIYDGVQDGVTIADPSSTGAAIEFSILTSFQQMEEHATQTMPDLIRVITHQAGAASAVFNTKAIFDYRISPLVNDAQGEALNLSADLWDAGLWDTAIWGSNSDEPISFVEGSGGIGRVVAIAMKGESKSRLLLIAFDVAYHKGGFL